MKIAIKLSLNQFEVLHSLVENFEPNQTQYLGRETRVRRYILEKPITKIQKQWIDVKKSTDLFNQKKKVKITLEYYEAHYFEVWLSILDQDKAHQDVNMWNVIKSIRAELNSKLA